MSLYVGVTNNTADQIGQTITDDQVINIIEKYYLPKFGDIKYVVRPSVEIINENSPDFDGWVYADGSVRNIADYPVAQQYYGRTSGTFNVENLYTFIQYDGHSDNITHLQSQIQDISEHCHHYNTNIQYHSDFVLTAAFNVIITGTTDCILMHPTPDRFGNHSCITVTASTYNINDINRYVDDGYVPALHGVDNAYASGLPVRSPLNLTINSNFKVIDIGYAGDEHPDCYPEHIKVFPFIYIGKKKPQGVL